MAMHHSTMRYRSCQSAGRSKPRFEAPKSAWYPCSPRATSRIGAQRSAGFESAVSSSAKPPNSTPTSTLKSSVDEAVQNSSREVLSSLGIAPIAPEQLFDRSHIEQWTPLLLAYLPFGCALAALRMAAWIGGIALDASWFRNPAVVDAYMSLLGVTVKWEGEVNFPQQRHVLVSNHITTGDLLVLFQRPQRYLHLITSALPQQVYAAQYLPAILQPANKHTYQALAETQPQQQQQVELQQQQQQQQQQHDLMHAPAGVQLNPTSSKPLLQQQQQQQQQQQHAQDHHHQHHLQLEAQHLQHEAVGVSAANSFNSSSSGSMQHTEVMQQQSVQPHQQQQQQQQQHTSIQQQQQQQPSVHLFPEGGMTNGKGMMRFSRGFMLFADKLPVVPVALGVQVAFPQISSHTIDSNFLTNLFWCSFQPWTIIEAKALPAMRLGPGESKAAFVQRVQLAIAEELRVWIADLNIQQKRQLAGRQQQQQKQKRQQH